MGQINCQCQYISNEEGISFKRNITNLHKLPQEYAQNTQIYTKLILKSQHNINILNLYDAKKATFGTTNDSEFKPSHLDANIFKIQVRQRNKYTFIKDCGIGLGAFLQKKKIIKYSDGIQCLINVRQKWIMICIKKSEQIYYCVYEGQKELKGKLQSKGQHQIILGEDKLLIIRQKQSRQYSIKLNTRAPFLIWLGQQRKLRAKDVLRLGHQYFEVQSINKYLQTMSTQRRE